MSVPRRSNIGSAPSAGPSKIVAVFWKHEVGEAGSEWIEPTATDDSHRDRWS